MAVDDSKIDTTTDSDANSGTGQIIATGFLKNDEFDDISDMVNYFK